MITTNRRDHAPHAQRHSRPAVFTKQSKPGRNAVARPASAEGGHRHLFGWRTHRTPAGLLAGTLAAALLFAWPGPTAAAPLAWAFGWLYLGWAADAPRLPAAITDGMLGLLTLAAGLLMTANPAWLFTAHAIAWPVRALADSRDARAPPVAASWMSFHAVMALLLQSFY